MKEHREEPLSSEEVWTGADGVEALTEEEGGEAEEMAAGADDGVGIGKLDCFGGLLVIELMSLVCVVVSDALLALVTVIGVPLGTEKS